MTAHLLEVEQIRRRPPPERPARARAEAEREKALRLRVLGAANAYEHAFGHEARMQLTKHVGRLIREALAKRPPPEHQRELF